MTGGHFPAPVSSHAEAGEVDAGAVDRKLFTDVVEEFDDAVLLVVIGPATCGRALWRDEDVGEFVPAPGHAGRSPFGHDAQGTPALTASMKEENDGPLPV